MALYAYNRDSSLTKTVSTRTVSKAYFYDTRLDSDGGAWRMKTQDTTWYKESSGSTRGSRKEFPVVALITCENFGAYEAVVIYDADDPSFPMWMVINVGTDMSNETILRGHSLRDAKMKNAMLVVPTGDTTSFIDFITEEHRLGHDGQWYWFPDRQGLYDRNRAIGEPSINRVMSRFDVGGNSGNGGLGDNDNHTVELELPPPGGVQFDRLYRRKGLPYPQALITSTGYGTTYVAFGDDMDSPYTVTNLHSYPSSLENYWMSPTEAVAIHNGPSSGQALDIYDPQRMYFDYRNGVANSGGYAPDHGWHNNLAGYPNVRSYAFGGSQILRGQETPIQALGFGPNGPYGFGSPNKYSFSKRDQVHIVGGDACQVLIKEKKDDPRNGMACITRDDFTTGWMVGNTVLALDAQSDTDLTGTNLLSNSYDPTTTNNWTISNTGSITFVNGAFRLTSSSYAGIYQTINVTAGVSYLVSLSWQDVNGTYASNGIDIRVKEGSTTSGSTVATITRTGNGGLEGIFTPGAGVTQVTVQIIPGRGGVPSGVSDINRIRVTQTFINDKSVYQHRMHVTGTVSRGTIPGSDISYFHNFGEGLQTNTTEASQLVIPAYNTYLDPASANVDDGYCMMAWVYANASVGGYEGVMGFGNSDLSESFNIGVGTTYGVYFDYGGGADYASTGANSWQIGRWVHLCCYVSPRQLGTIMIDGKHIDGENNSLGYNVRNRMNRDAPMANFDYQFTVGNVRGGHFDLNAANLRIALPKFMRTIPTDDQIKFIYDQERVWFQGGSGATGYPSNKARVNHDNMYEVDYDIHRNEHVIVGNNGVEVRSGSTRIEEISTGNSYDVGVIHDGKVVYGT